MSEATPQPSPAWPSFGRRRWILVGSAIVSAAIVYWGVKPVRDYIDANPWVLWTILAALIVSVGVFPVIAASYEWLKTAKESKRAGAVVVLEVVLIATLFLVVTLAGPDWRSLSIRVAFILIASALPGSLYYLFVVSRRESLLSDYESNLTRLGLDRKKAGEDDNDYQTRLNSYRERFEAIFGAMTGARQEAGGSIASKFARQARSGGFSPDRSAALIGATLLIAIGWLITLPPLEGTAWLDQGPSVAGFPQQQKADYWWMAISWPNLTPVHFAFLGAYFYSLQNLFRRYIRDDLGAGAYVGVSMRILLATVAVWVLQNVVELTGLASTAADGGAGAARLSTSSNTMLALGFAAGVFPSIVWQVVRNAVQKIPGLSIILPSLQDPLPPSHLDGVSVWQEARLEEEDIESIANMATVDVVDLLLKTRFPPHRIIEWIDQAILYRQLGETTATVDYEYDPAKSKDRLHFLLRYGIRNASGLVHFTEEVACEWKEEDFKRAWLPERQWFEAMVAVLRLNPNLHLIENWRAASDRVMPA